MTVGRSLRISLVVLSTLLIVLVLGCWSCLPDRDRAVSIFEGSFVALSELGVRSIWVTEWGHGRRADCASLQYERGHFVSPSCRNLGRARSGGLPLDDQAIADVETIRRAFGDPDTALWGADVTYASDGSAHSGTFRLDACGDYHYEPGYGSPPDYDSEDAISIDEDWYVVRWTLFELISGC